MESCLNPQIAFLLKTHDTLQQGACIVDQHCRIVHANEYLAEMLGQTASTLIDQNWCRQWCQLDDDDHKASPEASLPQLIAAGTVINGLTAVVSPNETTSLPVTIFAAPLPIETEEPYTLILLHDRTQIHALEASLNHERRRLREAQEVAQMGYWEHWPTLDKTVWTTGLYRLFGLNENETSPNNEQYLQLIHPDDRDKVAHTLEPDQIKTSTAYTARIVRPDGLVRTIRVFRKPMFEKGEMPTRIRGYAQDITTLIQMVDALHQSQARFKMVFENLRIGVVLLNSDGEIVQANPAWVHLVSQSDAESRGVRFNDYITPQFRPQCDQLFAELMEAENPQMHYTIEAQIDDADASPIWAKISVTHMANDDYPFNAVAMVENITKHHEAEDELREIKRRLARSRENERLYLAQDLHDGPMQDLYAAQFLLQKLRRYVSERGESVAKTIQTSLTQVNERLREITGELRPPALAPFGLEAAIRGYVEKFRERYPDIQVHLELTPDAQALPEYVRLTLYRIHQEVLNNVAKHAQARHVSIEFSLGKTDLLLEIRDDGIGFDVPARWIELARRDHYGLLGASERAEEIDGTLVVLSKPGNGTIVRVSAPHPLVSEHK